MEHQDVELTNSQIQDVLHQPPSWLMRWGTAIFFLSLLIIIGSTHFIKYPDTIKGNIKVISSNIPKSLSPILDGKISNLLIKDNSLVTKGQHLIYIESTAKNSEIFLLEMIVDKLIESSKQQDFRKLDNIQVPSLSNLGELQKSYQVFQESFILLKSLTREGTYERFRQLLLNDIEQLNSKYENVEIQKVNFKKDLELAEEDLHAQTILLNNKAISKVEYRTAVSKFLNKKQIFNQSESFQQDILLSRNEKQHQLLDLDKSSLEKRNILIQSLNTLKSDLNAWKQRFVISAPESGRISFITTLQDNLNVKLGQELIYIIPKNIGYHGELLVGQYNLGKLEIGQRVIIKFPSYPFHEFGAVEGIVQHISDIPRGTEYLVLVKFPKGLVTGMNKRIQFRYSLIGEAQILTSDVTLLQRFLNNIRGISSPY